MGSPVTSQICGKVELRPYAVKRASGSIDVYDMCGKGFVEWRDTNRLKKRRGLINRRE